MNPSASSPCAEDQGAADARDARQQVLIIGDVIDDLVVRPQGPVQRGTDTPSVIEPSPGGSGANQAAWVAACGGRVRFVGRVGAPDLSRHRAVLEAAGVEPRLVADPVRPTGRIVLLVDPDDGERTMFTDRGANLGLGDDPLSDALLDDVAVLHLSGYTLFEPRVAEAVLDLVSRARRREISISVDPASRGFLEAFGPERFLATIGVVDHLFPNLDEGRILTGETDPEEIVAGLLEHAVTVALTLGAEGVLIADRSGELRWTAAPPVEVVDTTGAGDAFCGAYLAGWATGDRGDTLATAAVAAAARAVMELGGRPR